MQHSRLTWVGKSKFEQTQNKRESRQWSLVWRTTWEHIIEAGFSFTWDQLRKLKVHPLPNIGLELYQLGVHKRAKKIVWVANSCEKWLNNRIKFSKGSGCSTVGSSDASDTTDPRFVSSHWQFLFTVNFFKKTKIKKKEAENCPIFLNQVLQSTHQNLVVW